MSSSILCILPYLRECRSIYIDISSIKWNLIHNVILNPSCIRQEGSVGNQDLEILSTLSVSAEPPMSMGTRLRSVVEPEFRQRGHHL